MKRIVLKSLAITLSAISLLNVSPINALADKKLDEPQITQQLQEKDATTEWESELLKYVKVGLIGAGVGVGTYVFFRLLTIGIHTKYVDHITEQTRKEYLEKFKGHIGPNILTKRQEGVGWCWLACLQALLKDRGIEKSQKELFKGITDKSPGWFEVTRRNVMEPPKNFFEVVLELLNKEGKRIANLIEPVDYYAVEKYIIEKFNLSFCYKRIQVTEDNTDDICNSIKNVYERNNKKPFAILDSMVAGVKNDIIYVHMVNVVEINGNDITIECPQTGLRRTENIYDFAKRYNENEAFRCKDVFLYWIS